MSEVIENKQYTIKEYLELDALGEGKYEYVAGKIRAMTGGSINHALISGNVFSALNKITENRDCLALNSDAKIWIKNANAYVYPDSMVICGGIETDTQEKDAVSNPILIVEVLSKSTGLYDRGEKFYRYCSLPSFCEYLLIDQDKPIVDSLYRDPNEVGSWRMTTIIGLDKSVVLHSLDCSISMSEIYRNVRDLQAPQIAIDF